MGLDPKSPATALTQPAGAVLDELVAELETSELSTIRHVVAGVMSAMANPEAGIQELKEVVEVDPPLTAKVLRLANSAFYARGRTYRTIEEAVIWIGFDAMLRLTLSQKVCELFADGGEFHGYSRRTLWRHSTATALLARLISRREFGIRGETAYVCGLLHDIGIIIVDQFRHDAFLQALKLCAARNLPLADGLREALGLDHAAISAALAQRWNWPAEITAAIGGLRDPLAAPRPHARLTRVLCVANRSCHDNRLGYGLPAAGPADEVWDRCLQELEVRPLALELMHADLNGEIASLESKGLL